MNLDLEDSNIGRLIQSGSGLEFLDSLKYLNLSDNLLEIVDVSKLVFGSSSNLERIDFLYNPSLDSEFASTNLKPPFPAVKIVTGEPYDSILGIYNCSQNFKSRLRLGFWTQ